MNQIMSILSSNTPSDIAAIESYLGKPITRCPPALDTAYSNLEIFNKVCGSLLHAGRDNNTYVLSVRPRARYTSNRGRLPSPVSDLIQPGRSVSWLVSRGVNRKNIAKAVKNGWLTLSTRTST